jgi:hypothetical protein
MIRGGEGVKGINYLKIFNIIDYQEEREFYVIQ